MKRFYCNGKKGFCDYDDETRNCVPCGFCDGSGGGHIEVEEFESPYWNRICALFERQRVKGIQTYGQGLEKNPAGILKRLEHLEEELVDALMYIEWIKDYIGKDEDHESNADGESS